MTEINHDIRPNIRIHEKSWTLSNRFSKALQNHDVVEVVLLIDCGFDVDRKLINDCNGIAICAQRGWLDMARLLIKNGCSLSLANDDGHTPLHLAVMNRHIEVAELLLQNRANVLSQDSLGLTPLHVACSADDLGMVKLLLREDNTVKKQLSIRCRRKITPFLRACSNGSYELNKHILSKAPDIVGSTGFLPIAHVLFNSACSPEMVQMILDHGTKLNTDSWDFRYFLILLVKKFVDSREMWRSTLYSALEKSDMNEESWVLGAAIYTEDPDLVRKVMNNGCCEIVHRFYEQELNEHWHDDPPSEKILQLLRDSGLYDRPRSELLDLSLRNKQWYDREYNRARQMESLKHACRSKIRNLVLPRRIEKVVDQLRLFPHLNNFLLLCS